MDFKIGEKVKLIYDNHPVFCLGAVVTIASELNSADQFEVEESKNAVVYLNEIRKLTKLELSMK